MRKLLVGLAILLAVAIVVTPAWGRSRRTSAVGVGVVGVNVGVGTLPGGSFVGVNPTFVVGGPLETTLFPFRFVSTGVPTFGPVVSGPVVTRPTVTRPVVTVPTVTNPTVTPVTSPTVTAPTATLTPPDRDVFTGARIVIFPDPARARP